MISFIETYVGRADWAQVSARFELERGWLGHTRGGSERSSAPHFPFGARELRTKNLLLARFLFEGKASSHKNWPPNVFDNSRLARGTRTDAFFCIVFGTASWLSMSAAAATGPLPPEVTRAATRAATQQ